MTQPSVCAVMRTNIPKQFIKKEFLNKLTRYLCREYRTDEVHVSVEVQADVLMMRGGSTSPMININVYHNTSDISQETKGVNATEMAQFMKKELGVSTESWIHPGVEKGRGQIDQMGLLQKDCIHVE